MPCCGSNPDQSRANGVGFAGPTAIALSLLLLSGPARADVESLAKLVPADVLAAYLVDVPAGVEGEPKSNSFEIATVLIDQAFGLGFLNSLDIAIRGWLDTIACVSAVISHPHAVMLFDIQAERDEDESHRVSNLRAALVMRTDGNNKAIEHRIQHLLGVYTNQAESTLDTIPIGDLTAHRLKDRRLADWVVVCWASAGDYFVVALGEESIRQVVATIQMKTESIWKDSNFREGVESLAAKHSLVTVLLRFDDMRKRSILLGRKLGYVQAALDMPNCGQGVWAAGFSGRSLEIRQWLLYGTKGSTAVIAGAEHLADGAKHALPEAAHAYADLGVEPKTWFERIRNAYLAARSRKNAAQSRAYWAEVEQSAGLRFGDLFAHLGGPILVHDFPEHALRLPPAWTIVIPVKSEPNLVRKDVDAILTFWQRALEGSALGLGHTDDGIWYMQVGIEGPALKVMDRNLVFSFSPLAVRQNLKLLEDK